MRFLLFIALVATTSAQAFNVGGTSMPNLPTSGKDFHGSAGAGFTDFNVISPNVDFKLDRGIFVAGSIERAFNFLNLYLSLGLAYMNVSGVSNYQFTNLSSSTTYALNDVKFRANLYELNLGLKLKLIDDYWFKPYVEGGGVGSYYEISYDQSAAKTLSASGSDYLQKDVIMGSGYYGEGGLEIGFTSTFGVKIAARQSTVQTKKLDTLGVRPLILQSQTFYLAALFGF